MAIKKEAVLLLIILLFLSGCNNCGNGKIDKGENKYTCCTDAGCDKGQDSKRQLQRHKPLHNKRDLSRLQNIFSV